MYATIKAKIDQRQPLTRPEWLALTQKARALAAVAPHSASRRFYVILQCAALRTIAREGYGRA